MQESYRVVKHLIEVVVKDVRSGLLKNRDSSTVESMELSMRGK